jgi:hypothetical protein
MSKGKRNSMQKIDKKPFGKLRKADTIKTQFLGNRL